MWKSWRPRYFAIFSSASLEIHKKKRKCLKLKHGRIYLLTLRWMIPLKNKIKEKTSRFVVLSLLDYSKCIGRYHLYNFTMKSDPFCVDVRNSWLAIFNASHGKTALYALGKSFEFFWKSFFNPFLQWECTFCYRWCNIRALLQWYSRYKHLLCLNWNI